MKNYKLEVAKLLAAQITDLTQDEIYNMVEMPPDSSKGDYAFPCFKLAKTLRMAPPKIAADIAEKLEKADFIDNIEVVNAYINFFLNKGEYAKDVIDSVVALGDKYGQAEKHDKGTVVIDYSSPNIAKPFHVGHLRSTVIGNSLYQIFNALGYDCVGVNHLGDWGTQFGKLIVAYGKWSSKEAVEEKGVEELLRIYVKFHEEAEKNPELDQEARNAFTALEHGDEEKLALWKWFKEVSLAEFERVYKLLNVSFDSYNGEAFYNDKMDAVIKELEDKGLIEVDEGVKLVRLDDCNMSPCLITKNDGSSLYATRDLAAAMYRKKTYDFAKCIYVTAVQQNLHFAQWFKVVEKMGYDWSKNLVHVPFGMVSMEGGKISTRSGNVIFLEDILNQAINKTKEIIEQKNPNLPNKEEVAKQVGIGAVIFDDMYNNIVKDIVFSWDRVLDFQGETGPYVQYTHVRTCSLLRKAGIDPNNLPDLKITNMDIINDDAFAVVKEIANFPNIIQVAANNYEPSYIARYAVDLAQAFNKFYDKSPILVDDEEVKNSRLAIVVAAKHTLKNALALLGIEAPEQM